MKAPYTYILAEDGFQLWGHEDGRRIRGKIEALLDKVPPSGSLTIELQDVQVMDFSFSGEVFGKLISSLSTSYPARGLVLMNPSQYVKANLNAALDSMNLMALIVDVSGKWDVIGKVAETDRETMRVLSIRSAATASELAEALGIKLTTCNQRLKKLMENGVILREKVSGSNGGERLVYQWLV